jgi:Flp pilus assembly protein TadG
MRAARLLRSASGAGAAEFAIVLPLFLVLLFGIIDGARFVWEYNKAEKATQVGARVAAVTNVLSPGLRDEDYAGQTAGGTTIGAGDKIPAEALGSIKCSNTACTCETAPCPSDLGTLDTATFDILVQRMSEIHPAIQPENVVVRYSGSGFGFAGTASQGGGGSGTEQMEISPLITVTLDGLEFRPITSLLLASLSMPEFATTLTAEDSVGSVSN